MTKQDLGNKVWYDPDANGYIGLDVTENIPHQTPQNIEGTNLLPKDEYHCSLLAPRKYFDDRKREQLIADAVKEFLESHALHYVGIDEARYLCKKDGRMTIIAPVEIEGIKAFQALIRTLLPEYTPPFPHVTLLKSKMTTFGIGINRMSDLDLYCKRIK